MNARALLAELTAAGVRLSLAGDALCYQTRRGVSIAPHLDEIMAHKPALLIDLLQARIIRVVTADPDTFDRAEYERLLAQWERHDVALRAARQLGLESAAPAAVLTPVRRRR